MELVKHSYRDDCIFLLKDLSNVIREITVEEKEELISKGISYSEVISKESEPSKEIENIFLDLLEKNKLELAKYIAILSNEIYLEKGNNLVLVSLARAGTPYGILIKKYLKDKFNIDIPHYSISIIRGKGIDENAVKYILKNHPNGEIQFVDGWTGKGSITFELSKSINKFNLENECMIDSGLAVIADPAKLSRFYGTREDIAIPNCCLNSTVSGLISRTILNEKYIGENDFHGAKYLDYLKKKDLSQYYIDAISKEFENIDEESVKNHISDGIDLDYAREITEKVKKDFKVKNINKIKLSIGESSRVLLRRKARIVLVRDKNDFNLRHILEMAREKNVKVEEYDLGKYNCISLIEEEEES